MLLEIWEIRADLEEVFEKVPFAVTGTDDDMGDEADGTCPWRLDVDHSRHSTNTLLVNLRHDNADLRGKVAGIHEKHERLLMAMNRNLIHLMRNPVLRLQHQQNHRDADNGIANAENAIEQQANTAMLSKSVIYMTNW